MTVLAQRIREIMAGRYPITCLRTTEESRVLAAVNEVATDLGTKSSVRTWSCLTGLEGSDGDATRDAAVALTAIRDDVQAGFVVMKDLLRFLDKPDVARSLRETHEVLLQDGSCFLVTVGVDLTVPDELSKCIHVTDVPLPQIDELLEHLRAIAATYKDTELSEEILAEVALGLRGLTLDEAAHVIHSALAGEAVTEKTIMRRIFSAKQKSLRETGVLEFVADNLSLDDVGGLDVLKDWANKRKDLFTQKALDEGLPVPKGILIMGVSGCGKSLCAKAIPQLWRVPLFRLDMSQVFSGLYGSPEAAFHAALRRIETIAPAVLWIDEVENAMGMTTDTSTADQTLTFSAFLTWMQERPPLVFVAATANQIQTLPAEMIRKGRFDEVFFCDLPTENERKQIVEIHLRKNGIDPGDVDPERLLYPTRGWTGAEIEQAVISARVEAYAEGRETTLDDIRTQMRGMVPLSQTMSEQIKEIRSWSHYRAKRASKAPPKSMLPEGE